MSNIGLEPDEIGLEASYLHFREGYQLNSRKLAERLNNFDDSIDIFESISRDQPQGLSFYYSRAVPLTCDTP